MSVPLKTTASQLKARLGQFMRAVRRGREVVVTDRDEPVVKLIPFHPPPGERESMEIVSPRDPASPGLGKLKFKRLGLRVDVVRLLEEDRERR